MKTGILFFLLIGFWGRQDVPRSGTGGASVLGIFAGTSPCGTTPKSLLGISVTDPCDQLKWRLTLYQDATTRTPTTFSLDSEVGYFVDNQTTKTTAVKKGITGKWEITQGTKADPKAVVYRLNPDKPGQSLLFLRVHPALLHPLNPDKGLMVGTGGASYTLNKID